MIVVYINTLRGNTIRPLLPASEARPSFLYYNLIAPVSRIILCMPALAKIIMRILTCGGT